MEKECSRVQGMIESFLSGKLYGVDRQSFVSHVRSCKVCRDELEVYHVIYSVVEQLDNDEMDEDSDYIGSLEKKLNFTDSAGKKWRMMNFIIAIMGIGGFVMILLGVLLLVG